MGLLKGIPSNLSPELLYALAKMGHGDEIVLGDANFPSRLHIKLLNFHLHLCKGASIYDVRTGGGGG